MSNVNRKRARGLFPFFHSALQKSDFGGGLSSRIRGLRSLPQEVKRGLFFFGPPEFEKEFQTWCVGR